MHSPAWHHCQQATHGLLLPTYKELASYYAMCADEGMFTVEVTALATLYVGRQRLAYTCAIKSTHRLYVVSVRAVQEMMRVQQYHTLHLPTCSRQRGVDASGQTTPCVPSVGTSVLCHGNAYLHRGTHGLPLPCGEVRGTHGSQSMTPYLPIVPHHLATTAPAQTEEAATT